MNPVTVGLKRITDILSAFYVRNSSGTEKAIYDTDGYLYQGGTKLTKTAAEMNTLDVHVVCQRFTIAQINAGVDLITPSATGKWQVANAWMRAIGGAVGAVTTIDVKEETSGNLVFQVPQASLTQNTIILPNSANVVATYLGVESTAGKKLRAIKAGSDITTATHIDICITYVNTVA